MAWLTLPRDRRPEVMDQPGLAEREHRAALAGLARLNRLSASSRILWPPLAMLARRSARPIRVLDIACGGADVTISLARRATRVGLPMHLIGCDRSETALAVARDNAVRSGVMLDLFAADALHDPLPEGVDAVVCSLFLHHLSAQEAVALLRKMAASAKDLVLVNDLVRSRWGYFLAVAACRLLTRSAVVRTDGPLSVQGAFTMDEARQLAHSAGLTGARVASRFPARYVIEWWKR